MILKLAEVALTLKRQYGESRKIVLCIFIYICTHTYTKWKIDLFLFGWICEVCLSALEKYIPLNQDGYFYCDVFMIPYHLKTSEQFLMIYQLGIYVDAYCKGDLHHRKDLGRGRRGMIFKE